MTEPARIHAPAVVDHELVRLSVSQIVFFDRESDGCPRKWYRKYVLRDRPPCKVCKKRGGAHEPNCTAANAKGDTYHADIEHYLKTGEDALSPRIRAGKHFLPRPGADLLPEHKFDGEQLTLIGLPVAGKIDLLHNRGVVVDSDGSTRPETEGQRVAEVLDWKTTVRLVAAVTRGGQSLPAYTKSSAQLVDLIQLQVYGKVAQRVYPHITHVRLSHGYFQTSGRPAADKRSILVPLDTLNSKWDKRAVPLTREMRDAAREREFLKIEPNWNACESFGGCPYKAECPRSAEQHAIDLFGKGSPTMQSLLRRNAAQAPQQTAPVANPNTTLGRALTAPLTSPAVQHAAATVAAEQARLVQAQQIAIAQGTTVTYDQTSAPKGVGFCSSCGAQLTTHNASLLADRTTWKHIGCPAQPAQVVSNDAPQSQPHLAAQPVPAEVAMAQTPAVQAAIAQHAAQAAQTAPAGSPFGTAPTEPQTTRKPRTSRKTAAAPVQTVTHNAAPQAVHSPDAEGDLVVFVNCIVEGAEVRSLDSYLRELAETLCNQYGAADLRCAPDTTPLSHGKWRGALAAAIRASLPEPGVYLINIGDSELHAVLAETLREEATTYVRGVR